MADKVNRRTLGKTTGALAGVAVAGRSASATAQEATPAASPVAMDTVDEFIANWPDVSREVAQTVMDTYGPPHEATASFLIWFNNGPWKRTMLSRDPVPHDFPVPHPDLLEQIIDYQVPPDMYDELAQYDGSVIVERTKGEMSARCDAEAANFLALSLANDIVTGERSVEEARQFYGDTMKTFKEEGQSDPYLEGFVFEVPEGGTKDPDEQIVEIEQ